MCYYITATLPDKVKNEAFGQVFDKFDMAFDPINNAHIKSQLREEQYFRATKAYCDCDTVLGILSTSQRQAALMDSKKVKKLRKKGWTEEEIENWAKDKIAKKKKKVRKNLWPEMINKLATHWIDFIREMFNTGKITRLGLLKHWYSIGLESEEIVIKETKKVNIQDISVDMLTHLDEDILYEFFNK
ncbi:MAG: hypothetical protein ACFFDN_05420 [Candidatus Hodarchaeota archaeon]